MKKVLGLALGLSLMIPAVTQAAAPQKPVNAWTCEDFLALDTAFQPTAVGFAEALSSKDKPEDAVLDVNGIETLTPLVIQACTADKAANFKASVESQKAKAK